MIKQYDRSMAAKPECLKHSALILQYYNAGVPENGKIRLFLFGPVLEVFCKIQTWAVHWFVSHSFYFWL